MNQEGRRHARFSCEHPIWLRPLKGDDEYELAEAYNISKGGAYCLTRGPLKVNQLLEITMEVPEQYELVTMRGPIKHVERLSKDRYLCGLEFSEVKTMTPKDFNHTIEEIAAHHNTTD